MISQDWIRKQRVGSAALVLLLGSSLVPRTLGQTAALPPAAEEDPAEVSKLNPTMFAWSREGAPDEAQLAVVNFVDSIVLPSFPGALASEPLDSPANERIQEEISALIKSIEEAREPRYSQLRRELERDHGVEVVATYWITNAMLMMLPRRAVEALARRPDVLYIEPNETQQPPPDSNPNNDVVWARAQINSEQYFPFNGSSGLIALLDTGMRFTHTQFGESPSRIRHRRDCGPCTANNCTTGPGGAACNAHPGDDCWQHGTSSGAIMMANANQGISYRGVTKATLDSFNVYTTMSGECSGANVDAVVRAFQAAVAAGDHVIVAEMQFSSSDTGAVATAADGAFDTGKVVIAANGNIGTVSTVASPANAHKAIGVGAYDVETRLTFVSQAPGPAPDGRIKPDLQMPSGTETAGATTDTALRLFGGTSGATPYAAGLALLWRNFLGLAPEPGHVYSHLILSGPLTFPNFDNTRGVGQGEMPNRNGAFFRGKVFVSQGQVIDVPINLGSYTQIWNLQAALWWPEGVSQSHNNIDLHLIAPTGTVRASSTSVPSIFERATVGATIALATWKLRIQGVSVPAAPQAVYWAAFAETGLATRN